MQTAKNLYEKRVSLTLAAFQITESFLKEYITLSYDVMRHLLRNHIDFSSSREDIENHSLERLISIFKTINGDESLVKQLRSVVEHRNRIAHKALLPLYDGGKTTEDQYWELIDDIVPLEGEIDKCMAGVQRELAKLDAKAKAIQVQRK